MVDFNENVYHRRGVDGRDHIPALPFWVAIIRIFQFILSIIVLALAAFGASVFGASYFEGYAMTFFVFAWTILFLLYIFITPLWFPKAYLYWAHLGLEIFTVIFWLVAFALLAQEAQAWGAAQGLVNEINGIFSESNIGFSVWPKGDSAIKATKAAAGLGGLTWLLFIITLITFSFFLHKHRVAHGAQGFRTSAPPADVETAQAAPVSAEKEVAPEVNHVPQQPQPAVTAA